jgi:predicted esterase YcpF (UPF0227 family)
MIIVISEKKVECERNLKWFAENFPLEKIAYVELISNDSDYHMLMANDLLKIYSESLVCDEPFFIGYSQGCKIAEYLANVFESSAVLINPAMSPRILLPKRKERNDLYYWSCVDSLFAKSKKIDISWIDRDSSIVEFFKEVEGEPLLFEEIPGLKNDMKAWGISL